MSPGLYVVMGVSGSGKSLIGAALAQALGVEFVEGDSYHSAENRARMAAGIPLTDDDRRDWLTAIAGILREAKRADAGLVAACSALKRGYRDVLRSGAPAVQFVYLAGSRATLAQRLAERRGHFMPPSLLESQLATLEEPSPDEGAWRCDIRDTAPDIVAYLMTRATSAAAQPSAR